MINSVKESWIKTKGISAALILSMVVQGSLLVSWGAKLDVRMEDHERRIEIVEGEMKSVSKDIASLSSKVSGIETVTRDMRDYMADIRQDLNTIALIADQSPRFLGRPKVK